MNTIVKILGFLLIFHFNANAKASLKPTPMQLPVEEFTREKNKSEENSFSCKPSYKKTFMKHLKAREQQSIRNFLQDESEIWEEMLVNLDVQTYSRFRIQGIKRVTHDFIQQCKHQKPQVIFQLFYAQNVFNPYSCEIPEQENALIHEIENETESVYSRRSSRNINKKNLKRWGCHIGQISGSANCYLEGDAQNSDSFLHCEAIQSTLSWN